MKTLSFLVAMLLSGLSQANVIENLGTPYTDIYGKKTCTTGKPCGNTCISMSYTCHVGTTPTTPVTPSNINPIAAFTATPEKGDAPLSVKVASQSYDIDGTIASHHWSASNGQTGNGNTSTLIFNTPGNYTLTLTVTDNRGGSGSKQIAITVNQPVQPVTTTPPTTTQPNNCSQLPLATVVDGDTLYFYAANGSLEKVRLSQIDAPEKSQAYGQEAKACLNRLVTNATLSICPEGKDKYGRTIANVLANGKDVGESLVSQGCAWAYTQYLHAGSILPELQAASKAARLGLWANNNPIYPSDYRHGTVPVIVYSSGDPVIPVTTETTATVWDRIFDWVEQAYPFELMNGTDTHSLDDGMKYRCYTKNNKDVTCAGVKNNNAYFYDGKNIIDLGSYQLFLDKAQQNGF